MTTINRCALFSVGWMLMAAFGVPAAAATLTMDDLTTRPLNGLIHPAGVTFGFTIGDVASNDAIYRRSGPGQLSFVNDPSIEGSVAGVVSMTFQTPTPVLQFGLARNQITLPLVNGAVVSLFDSGNSSLGVFSLTLTRITSYVETKFTYAGAPVKRALISFPSPPSTRFALDNLVFVPEPTTAVSATTMIVLAARHRRRRCAPTVAGA